MAVLLFLAAALVQGGETVLDPGVSQVAVFKPGLVYVVREANVPAGLNSFRLKSVPQALDGTLWVDSPDGAAVSELRTTLDTRAVAGMQNVTSISDLLSTAIGKIVELKVRDYSTGKAEVLSLRGKLLSYEGRQGSLTLVLPNGHFRSVNSNEIIDMSAAGLPTQTPRVRPRIDLRFRVNATKPSRVRITSLEFGAAWVANYRLNMNGVNGHLEASAQLGLGSLALNHTRVRLVTGLPNLGGKTQLDLASGSTSLSNYLENRPGRLSQITMDPFEAVEMAINNTGSNFGTFGGGGGRALVGGNGLVGQSIDFISYDPTDNSLVVRSGEDVPAFLSRAVQASRLEDLHSYDFETVTLPAGGRITRVLSATDLPLKTVYRWDSAGSNGFERVLRLRNASTAGWPAGSILLQTEGVPLAQVPMPFTAPGQDANLELGLAEDLIHRTETREIERKPLNDPRWINPVLVTEEQTFEVTNTRTDAVDIEVNCEVTGTLSDGAGSLVTKTAKSNGQNPSSRLTWQLTLAPGEHKTWTIKYQKVI